MEHVLVSFCLVPFPTTGHVDKSGKFTGQAPTAPEGQEALPEHVWPDATTLVSEQLRPVLQSQ